MLPMAPIMAIGFRISLDAHDLRIVSIGTPRAKCNRVPAQSQLLAMAIRSGAPTSMAVSKSHSEEEITPQTVTHLPRVKCRIKERPLAS